MAATAVFVASVSLPDGLTPTSYQPRCAFLRKHQVCAHIKLFKEGVRTCLGQAEDTNGHQAPVMHHVFVRPRLW